MVLLKDEDYLTGEMLSEKYNKIVILDAGKYVERYTDNRGKTEQLEIMVSFKHIPAGETTEQATRMIWTPNKGCRTALKQELGKDTKNWIGKVVVLGTYEKNVGGEAKDILEVKEIIDITPDQKQPTPQPVSKLTPKPEYECDICGAPIKENVHKYSLQHYKVAACFDCQNTKLKNGPKTNDPKVEEEEVKN